MHLSHPQLLDTVQLNPIIVDGLKIMILIIIVACVSLGNMYTKND